MGRPRDRAPEGYLTVREAADLLGITQPAVRQRIKRGTLPTRPGDAAHHYIPREAIEQEIQLAMAETTDEVAVRSNRNTELVLEALAELNAAVCAQREEVTAGLDKITERFEKLQTNQEEIKAGLGQALQIMREQAEREQVYQDRMMALFERVTKMLDREAERQDQRERCGRPKRRSLWRRLFGGG